MIWIFQLYSERELELVHNILSPTTNLSLIEIPKSIDEALLILKWRKVVEEEMSALNKNRNGKLQKKIKG